jgi:hypothetical protein
MGHILGLGTRWLSLGITGLGDDCPYLGIHANREYQALTGCTTIPTELDGEAGTRCVHFDEICLDGELMTGFINREGGNPLSRLTVAALEDLGYQVDYTMADSFSGSMIASSCHCGRFRSLVATLSREATLETRGHRRKLSEEMKTYAIKQGHEFLREQAQRIVELNARGDAGIGAPGDPSLIGDQVVSVWVQDTNDGDIYSVTVWADSAN